MRRDRVIPEKWSPSHLPVFKQMGDAVGGIMKAPEQLRQGNRVRWAAPDQEWLEAQLLTKSRRQVAAEVDTTAWTVTKWVTDLEIADRQIVALSSNPEAPKRIGKGCGMRFVGVTKEWLYKEYVMLDKSPDEIGKSVGASSNAIFVWLYKFGIRTRTPEQKAARHSRRMAGKGNPAWNGGVNRNYQIRLLKKSDREKVCEWCGTGQDLEVHHRDHNTQNGELDNLAWLCHECNLLEAYLNQLVKAHRARYDLDSENGKLIIQFILKEIRE